MELNLTLIAIQLGSLLVAFALHEAGHAYCAKFLGDDTAERLGRLTLNPIPHLDPFGSIILPLMLIFVGFPLVFAAAKPVSVNPRNFKRPIADFAIVALAGPMVNILLAIGGALVFGLVMPGDLLSQTLFRQFIWINIVLAMFNLIPLPPLDGSKIIAALMPRPLAMRWLALDRFGLLFIGLLIVVPLLLGFSLIGIWIVVLASGFIPILSAVSGENMYLFLQIPPLELILAELGLS